MLKEYRKTATIKAEQFDGSKEMIEKYSITPPMPLDPDYTINTLEGDMVLGVGLLQVLIVKIGLLPMKSLRRLMKR